MQWLYICIALQAAVVVVVISRIINSRSSDHCDSRSSSCGGGIRSSSGSISISVVVVVVVVKVLVVVIVIVLVAEALLEVFIKIIMISIRLHYLKLQH